MIIYLVTNLWNDKIYVGKTATSVDERWSSHVKEAALGRDRALCRAIRKYGDGFFTVEPIACAQNLEALNELEIEIIAQYRSNDPKIGYNQTSGGEGGDAFRGRIHSEKSKTKISQTMRNAKRGQLIEVHCAWCTNKFKRRPGIIERNGLKRKCAGPFCGKKCSGAYGASLQNGGTRLPSQFI